jgi:hypothetical protein
MSRKRKNNPDQQPQNKNTNEATNAVDSTNTNQEHNTKKEALGPNTKR